MFTLRSLFQKVAGRALMRRSLIPAALVAAVIATALLPGAAVANHNCGTVVSVATSPSSQTITYGDNATFTASANGTSPTVQWQSSTNSGGNWTNIAGATSTTLVVVKPPFSSPAVQYRAVFSQSCHQDPTATTNAATLTVNKKALTVTGVTANSKIYDTTTTGTVNTGSATLNGVVSGDSVTLGTALASGVFADKNVGVNKVVQVAGLAISGASAGNYTLTQPTSQADITPAGLTVVNVTAADRVYDTTVNAAVDSSTAALSGVLGSDVVTLNGSPSTGLFADKHVGDNKPVTVTGFSKSGADAGNYTLTQPTPQADITPAGLTVDGVGAENKVYDALVGATLTGVGSATLNGVLGSDVVTLGTSGVSGVFGNKNVGDDKPVTVTGFSKSGADAGNYTLTQPTPQADITPAGLTVVNVTAADRVYDTTVNAAVDSSTAALSGVLGSDVVTLNGSPSTGLFADKHVGDNKPVTVTGFSKSGADAGNYTLTQPTPQADITPAGLTVVNVTAADRVYDTTVNAAVDSSTAALSGVLGSDVVTLNGSPSTGLFADKHVGDNKPVTVTGFSKSGADAGNYTLTQPTPQADITPAGLTVDGVGAENKVYDALVGATLTGVGSATLNGVLGSDVVTLGTSGVSGVFGNKNVGDDKPVTVTGFSKSGADAGNYTLTQPTPQADITPAGLTVVNVTAADRVYDTTVNAAVDSSTAALSGVLGSDVVTLNGSPSTGLFADKHVGDNKPVTVTGFSKSGADAGNYTLTQPTPQADITPAGLTVVNVTAADRVYDTTVNAAVDSSTAALSGVLGSDVVTLNGSPSTGLFADKHVGDNKPVTVTGFSKSGADAGNYTLTQPTPQADITPAGLTVDGVGAENKVYDALVGATLTGVGSATLNGVLGSDVVTLGTSGVSGVFGNKNVGDDKPVTVTGFSKSGADAGNYTLTQPTPQADITPAGLTVVNVTAADRVYDTTVNAAVDSSTAALSGVLGSDVVTLNGSPSTGLFADKHVGDNKPVTVTGFSKSGADAGNYTLTQPTPQADITPAGLTVVNVTAADRVYDTTVNAAVDSSTAALSGVLGSDVVTLNGSPSTGLFADKHVGDNKPVTVTGFSKSGADAGNYTLTQPTPQADITPAGLTVDGVGAENKVYDALVGATLTGVGSATLNGVLGSDVVTLGTSGVSGVFGNKNVGDDKPVTVTGFSKSGADAGNYTLTQPTPQADITPAGLTVDGVGAENKVYDGTTAATLTGVGSATLNGVLGSDVVTLGTSGVSGVFGNKNVGDDKPVTVTGFSKSGADAGNYTLTQPTPQADITPAGLTVDGVGAENKVYDGTTAATLTGVGSATLNGVLGSDVVTLGTSGVSGVFGNKNVGDDKPVTVTGFSKSGADAGNYTLTQPTPQADITAKSVTGSFTAADKVYDGGAGATVTPGPVSGVISGDNVSLSGGTASFANSSVGNDKTVTLSGASLVGADQINYTLGSVGTDTANITPKSVTGSFTAANKVADGTTAATITGRSLSGAVAGDAVSLTGGTATFNDPNPGVNKPVTGTGFALGGAEAGNYSLGSVGATTATITQRQVAEQEPPTDEELEQAAADKLGGDVKQLDLGLGDLALVFAPEDQTNKIKAVNQALFAIGGCAEACEIGAKNTVVLTGTDGGASAAATQKLRLKPQNLSLGAFEFGVVKLKLTRKQKKAIRKATKARLVTKITVESGGQTETGKKTYRLKATKA